MKAWWVLGVIVVLALALRLWHLDHGLPYAYNADENSHFLPRAIGMFGHDLDPGYYVNPSAYTYVLHILLAVRYGARTASKSEQSVEASRKKRPGLGSFCAIARHNTMSYRVRRDTPPGRLSGVVSRNSSSKRERSHSMKCRLTLGHC